MQELRLIEFIGKGGARKMRELSDHLTVAVNSMTSIVDNLERKALVRRQRSAEDRRVIRVELTPPGLEVHRYLLNTRLQLCRSMLGTLTEDEQEIFLVLFRKIARGGRSLPLPALLTE